MVAMHIQFRASADGAALEIKAMDVNHNHETSKVLYAHYPSERRLPVELQNEAKNMLAMKANKKIVQQKLQAQTGKIITLRDLTNIQAKLTSSKARDLDHCINILGTEYSADVRVLEDEEHNFQGLFMQTATMKKVVAAYPEILAIDATYKLFQISVPVYVIVAEDGACETEIVAVCLLTTEDQQTLSWFLRTFQEMNPESENTKCIITDKDMSERQVIRRIFPNASLITCIFHSLRTFRREVTCEKLGITQAHRIQSLEIFQKLLYASTDEEFYELESSLKELASKPVQDYYNKNWKNIRNEWNLNPEFMKSNFMNNTNNRLECMNSKLKSVIDKNSSLEEFVHGLLTIIISLQQERDHKAVCPLQKRICLKYAKDSDEYKYFDYLTREAAKHVLKEIEQSSMTVHENNDSNSQRFTVRRGRNLLQVTEKSCSCEFFVAMTLPCRHIFAVRKYMNLPIFDGSLVDRRWTLNYFKAHRRIYTAHSSDQTDNENIIVTTQPTSTTLSYAQKRKKALSRTDVLAYLCAQRSNMLYEQRCHILDDLIAYWKAGADVCLKLVDDVASNDRAINETYHEDQVADPEGTVLVEHQTLRIDDEINNNWAESTDEQRILLDSVLPVIQQETVDISDKENNNPTRNDIFEKEPRKRNIDLPDQEFQPTKEDQRLNPNKSNNVTVVPISTVAISAIKMPGLVKQRGRPKDQNVTVVGLPKKSKKPLPYCRIPIVEKQKFLLGHPISDSSIITGVIENGNLIEEDLVEIRPEKISNALLDEEIDVHLVRKFFTHDAWKAVDQVLRIVKDKEIWICNSCQRDLSDYPSILCDGCLVWHHLKCVNLKTRPEAKLWFCKACFSRSG